MFTYQNVTEQNACILREYYKNCNYQLCEYTVGTKLMWEEELHPEWTESDGCLIVRNEFQGNKIYDFPVPGPDGDVDAALLSIEKDAFETGIPLCISIVPECESVRLLKRYPYVHVYNIRTWDDYIYRAEDLATFAGRKYSGQRNHIHKFEKVCPNAVFKELDVEDLPAIDRFWEDYEKEFGKEDIVKAADELRFSKRMLTMVGRKWFRAGAMFDGDRIIALALAEKCGNTMTIHIEKAIYSYEGIYPTFVRAFAGHFGGDCEFINREDDAADRGLRTSKLQYHPLTLAQKYVFKPINDLQEHVHEFPVITTARLVLDRMKEEDIPAYNELVLDRERNRWWGYDDLGSLTEPYTKHSFFDVQEADWTARNAINFAIRLDGKFIGEAVLYNFDFRGGAELGCRIAKEYAGNGYGTEAFQAVANWALYTVHMRNIVAKCYHENEASFRMLSSCMNKAGRDETYDYFRKEV
ncbi:MAG: GNAT family N-acetyltransferase [Lachnospiraceae bacterium]|nr:GNAT family N-acetyltransferase [Lachnospiraceae bacterium]